MNVEVGTAFRMTEEEAGRNVRAGGRTGRGRKGREGGKKRDRNREDGERQIVVVVVV